MSQGTAFGLWLNRHRHRMGISRKELAEAAQCSEVLVSKMELGTRKPSEQAALLLARFLGLPADEHEAFAAFARADLPAAELEQLSSSQPGQRGSSTSQQREGAGSPWRAWYRRTVHLPSPATLFIGREEVLASVRTIMQSRGTRLLTLLGPPGIGKTRLGLRLAGSLSATFPDGVYFVGLAAIRDPGLVLSSMVRALDLQEEGSQALVDTLSNFLGHKRILVVLDNFEQVVPAAPYVARLLASCPALKVLVTSREALHLPGERRFTVPPLVAAEPGHASSRPADELARNEAVRLFVERARAVDPDFRLTTQNASAIGDICMRLDRLPLAIELAAARAGSLSLQEILATLRSRLPGSASESGGDPAGATATIGRLQLLADGARDLTARQQTLRGAIDWSYDLLDERERDLFCALSVFRGEFTAQIAAEVVGGVGRGDFSTERGIHTLTGKSLLQTGSSLRAPSRADAALGQDSEPKYWMLETIREYASEKLVESGKSGQLGRQHALFFMAMAEEAEPHLTGPGQREWLDRLEEQYDNIQAALWWARTASRGVEQEPQGNRGLADNHAGKQAVEIGLQAAGALWRFWYVRGYISEGREQLAGMLETLASTEYEVSSTSYFVLRTKLGQAVKAKALNAAGLLAYRQGDYAAARALQEESLAIRRELGDMKTVASTLNNLGLVAYMEQDYVSSRALYEESLAIRRQLGDKLGITNSLNNLGILADEQGDYAWARSLYEESLAIRRDLGDKFGVASTLNNLGTIAYTHGDYAAARTLHEESLAIRRELNEKWGIAMCLLNLGQVAYRQADGELARRLYLEGLKLFYELGDRQAIAGCLSSLAAVEGMAASVGRNRAERVERAARAGRLLGAAEALLEVSGAGLEVIERDLFDRAAEIAHAWMDDASWQAVRQEGRALNMDQAVAYARGDWQAPGTP